MNRSRKTERPTYPAWLTNMLGAMLFFLLGMTVYALAAGRQEPAQLEGLRKDVAAVKDSVLLLASYSNLSDTVRERILEDAGLLRNQTMTDVWRERDEGVRGVGRRDTVQIGVVLLDALLTYYQQWGDLRGSVLLRTDLDGGKSLRITFDSLEEGRDLVGFVGRYRGKLSLSKVEFLPLHRAFGESGDSMASSLKSMSGFLIDAHLQDSPVTVELALSPSFSDSAK